MDNEAEPLRGTHQQRAVCGWGCLCDACWASERLIEKRSGETEWLELLQLELRTHEVLRRLIFDVYGDDAPGDLEGQPGRRAYGCDGER